MTVAEANKTVLRLIGDDGFHHVGDILNTYYSMAQRQIATTVCPIEKSMTLEAGVETELPRELYRIKRMNCEYTRNGRYITAKEDAVLTYFAYPADVVSESDEFEIDPEAQTALPYYAAAQLALADSDMRRHAVFTDSYNFILSNIASKPPVCRVVEV